MGMNCCHGNGELEMIMGMGNPIPIGNPIGISCEWETMAQLGMEMGRTGNHPIWEWEWPLYPWE